MDILKKCGGIQINFLKWKKEKMATSPHRRFYARQQDKVSIGKLQIKSGMIIEFNYRDKNKKTSRPLIFVMDTDEFVGR